MERVRRPLAYTPAGLSARGRVLAQLLRPLGPPDRLQPSLGRPPPACRPSLRQPLSPQSNGGKTTSAPRSQLQEVRNRVQKLTQ